MTNEEIENRLKELRQELGLTQEELARELGVSRQSLISLEKGRYLPSFPLSLLLEEYFDRPIRNIFGKDTTQGVGTTFPKVNLYRKDDRLIIESEVPGMSRDDLQITILKDQVRIVGEKREEQEIKRDNFYRRESRYGSFDRTMTLPEEIDSAKAKIRIVDGRLIIAAPIAKKKII